MNLTEVLDKASIKYEISHHKPTFTAQRMAAVEHVPGMNIAKPVVINADDTCYMCVLPACCRVDFNALKKQLGAKNVELVSESQMAKMFPECDLGAEPPIGDLFGLETLMDKTLESDEFVLFQSGSHDEAVKMKLEDFKKLTKPKILSFSYHMW